MGFICSSKLRVLSDRDSRSIAKTFERDEQVGGFRI